MKEKKGLFARLLPGEYDFFHALCEHMRKVTEGLAQLVSWFKEKDPRIAERVREIEHDADEIMLHITSHLAEVFATPIDREDIHQLTVNIDEIINYAKNTVRELEIFEIVPDEAMIRIATLILDGSCELYEAIRLMPNFSDPMKEHIARAVKCERLVEKIYRKCVNELFEMDDLKEILKRREVYRHLSNTADKLLDTASLLSMIAMKYE